MSAVEAPRDADATRRAHFGELFRSRLIAYALALGVMAVLVTAILTESVSFAILGSALVVVGVLSIVFFFADKMAERDFFSAFARAHGFAYLGRYELMAFTPLLGAGERRHCEKYMEGSLSRKRSDLRCSLSHYIFEVPNRGPLDTVDEDGAHPSYRSNPFTICAVDLGGGEVQFPGVFLSGVQKLKHDLDDGGWLQNRGFEEVSLESIQFSRRYRLRVDPLQDQIVVRQLFAPSFIVWLASHPLAPRFEFRAGVLVVYVGRLINDAAHLQWLLDATGEIAGRIESEIGGRSGQPTAA